MQTNDQKAEMNAYIISIVLNNFFAHISFVLLSFCTEYSYLWIFISALFILFSFSSNGIASTINETKIKYSILVYIVFFTISLVFYIILTLFINSYSWIFIIPTVIMSSIYISNYLKT